LDFDRPRMPGLISPFYSNGDIVKYLGIQPKADKFALISQVASAVAHLHDRFIIHGDVKGSNILINPQGEASLADFGLSRILHKSGFTTMTVSGTYRYMAPELYSVCEAEEFNPIKAQDWRWKAPELMAVALNEEDESIPRVVETTDVWAFSMTVIEILTGAIPFSNIKRHDSVIDFVMSGGRPKRERCRQINNEIWKVLEMCWDADIIQRPSMATLSNFFASQAATQRARL